MIKKVVSGLLAGVFVFAISCKEEENKITSQQSSSVQDASTADAYFNDAGDVSTSAYSAPDASKLSGRSSTGGKLVLNFTVDSDTRLKGASVTLTTADNNSLVNPQGTISIDYGTGQTDPAGTVRKGKILITYSGLRFVPTSFITITFDGYYVNGVKIEGKRTVTTSAVTTSSVTFVVKDENGKVIFTDNTFVTRSSNHIRKWVKGATYDKDQWIVEGTASGTTRDSKSYEIVITKALVFKVECALKKIFTPAEGEAIVTVDSLPIQINYGASGAACDDLATITVAGITKEISVKGS